MYVCKKIVKRFENTQTSKKSVLARKKFPHRGARSKIKKKSKKVNILSRGIR